MDDFGADIQEVTAGYAAGMLVGGVWGISEKARRGDSKVLSMFYVGEGLDVAEMSSLAVVRIDSMASP